MAHSTRTAWISNYFQDTPQGMGTTPEGSPKVSTAGVQSEKRDPPGPHDEGFRNVG